jgi:putative endonuclease
MSGTCCDTPAQDDGRGADPESGAEWTVYIIRCDDGSLYTGVTTDLERRLDEHRGSQRGARYFNGRRPVRIEYREAGHTRSSACRREAAIRKLGRAGKLRLIAGGTRNPAN